MSVAWHNFSAKHEDKEKPPPSYYNRLQGQDALDRFVDQVTGT